MRCTPTMSQTMTAARTLKYSRFSKLQMMQAMKLKRKLKHACPRAERPGAVYTMELKRSFWSLLAWFLRGKMKMSNSTA